LKQTEKIVRQYIFSFAEIKKALGIRGELKSSTLWEGLSPNDEEQGLSRDKETIEIITEEQK
jgi:hypothetical protein